MFLFQICSEHCNGTGSEVICSKLFQEALDALVSHFCYSCIVSDKVFNTNFILLYVIWLSAQASLTKIFVIIAKSEITIHVHIN